jgi:hypothetical protein
MEGGCRRGGKRWGVVLGTGCQVPKGAVVDRGSGGGERKARGWRRRRRRRSCPPEGFCRQVVALAVMWCDIVL